MRDLPSDERACSCHLFYGQVTYTTFLTHEYVAEARDRGDREVDAVDAVALRLWVALAVADELRVVPSGSSITMSWVYSGTFG